MDNKIILKQMIRLSRVIKDIKEARCKLSSVIAQTTYFVVDGDSSNFINNNANNSLLNCLYLEKYLRTSVSNACKYLDGFNKNTMEPIDYVSSSDVKNKFVDICNNEKVVATINLLTGVISLVKPEYKSAEDKRPVEKS